VSIQLLGKMEGSNLSEFPKFCGGSYLYEFQMKEPPISPNFKKKKAFFPIVYILSCKNTVFNSMLLVQLKTAGYNTFVSQISLFCQLVLFFI